MNAAAEYQKIKRAGSFGVAFGILQFIGLPLIIWFVWLQKLDTADFVGLVVANTLLLGVQGAILIMYGRRLKQITEGPDQLERARKACVTLLVTILTAGLIAFLLGGRMALVMLIYIAVLGQAVVTIRRLQAAGVSTPTGAQPTVINPADSSSDSKPNVTPPTPPTPPTSLN